MFLILYFIEAIFYFAVQLQYNVNSSVNVNSAQWKWLPWVSSFSAVPIPTHSWSETKKAL